MTPERTSRIQPPDNLTVALYRLARETPAEEFQERAMQCIRPALDFASGIWACGSLLPGHALRVRHAHLMNASSEALAEWHRLNRQDRVISMGLERLGSVMHLHAPTLFRSDTDAPMRDYARRWGRQSYLSVAIPHRDPELLSWISLYRPNPDHHYSERQRVHCQNLLPHLREAQVINRALHPEVSASQPGEDTRAIVIADLAGQLVHAPPAALALIAREWREAHDRVLPRPFVRDVIERGATRFVGRSISCTASFCAGLVVLRVRERRPADVLTPRRQLIAELFAAGRDYKEIARRAGIAPTTVRNHLRAIYSDLGAHNRAELIRLVGFPENQAG